MHEDYNTYACLCSSHWLLTVDYVESVQLLLGLLANCWFRASYSRFLALAQLCYNVLSVIARLPAMCPDKRPGQKPPDMCPPDRCLGSPDRRLLVHLPSRTNASPLFHWLFHAFSHVCLSQTVVVHLPDQCSACIVASRVQRSFRPKTILVTHYSYNQIGHTLQLRNNKKLIRRWDSERELYLRQHRTRTTKIQ